MTGVNDITFAVSVMACLIVLYMSGKIYAIIKGREISRKKKVLYFCLTLYVCFVFQITINNREAGSRMGVFGQLEFGRLTGDFLSIQKWIYSCLNIMLFVPLGAILTLIKNKAKAGKKIFMVILYCFLISFGIESIQLITASGYFELVDIVTNVSGGMIGSVLASTALRLRSWLNQKDR